MADLHYHIEHPGPRSRYIIQHVLGTMSGLEALEVVDRADLAGVQGPKLIYGKSVIEGAFQVVPAGLLDEVGIRHVDPVMVEGSLVPSFFATAGDHSFDVFAAAFYLLSRYEEVGEHEQDAHGRPVSAMLHAGRNGYIDRPIVDEWLWMLMDAWRQKDPGLPRLRRSYGQTATMDVDNGAMYKGRSWWRSLGGGIRDLMKGRSRRVMDRIGTLTGRQVDPYAVHEVFLELAKTNDARAIFNFLVAPRGRYDHAISIDHSFMQARLRSIAQGAEIGLHPGYHSSDAPALIQREKQRLEEFIERSVTISRQHFLRMRLPDTYRELERIGICEEHSMGFADRLGFRAGTCTPYPYYDLEREKKTDLWIHPFAMMDSALCYKMGLGPIQAVTQAKVMVDVVKRVQGRFISVWHERFLSGYGDEAGWEGVAGEVLKHARP